MQKKITYGGLGCALCILMLIGASYLPTLKAAFLFVASVIPYVIYHILDVKMAFAMYGATSVLAFFICQSGSPAVVAAFIICFGNYPIIKAIADKKTPVFKYILKAIFYVIYFVIIYLCFVKVLLLPIPYPVYLLFSLGIILFLVYDYLMYQTGIYLINRLKLQ